MRHRQQHARAAPGQQRRVADELQRVAEPLLVRDQDGAPSHAAGEGGQRGKQARGGQGGVAGHGQARLELGPALGEAARVQQGDGVVEPHARVGGTARHRLAAGGERLLQPPLGLERDAEVGPGGGVVGGEAEGVAEPLGRLGHAPELGQHGAQQDVRVHRVRREAQPVRHGGQRLLRAGGLVQPLRQGGVQARILRLAGKDGAQHRLGAGTVARGAALPAGGVVGAVPQQRHQVAHGMGVRRAGTAHADQQRRRALRIARRPRRQARQQRGVDVGGIGGQGRGHPQRVGGVAGLQQGVGLAQRLLAGHRGGPGRGGRRHARGSRLGRPRAPCGTLGQPRPAGNVAGRGRPCSLLAAATRRKIDTHGGSGRMDGFRGTERYVASRELEVAVNAAVALGRPLLVKGEPGTGKTVLAQEIARSLDRPLIEWHVKSTTKAQQGLYEYDAVSRLRDGQLGDARVHDIANYIAPASCGRRSTPTRPWSC